MSHSADPFVHPLAIRWADGDGLGHVNNALFLTYLEEGRDAFILPALEPGMTYVLARVELDFRRELRIDEMHRDNRSAQIEISVERVGRTSIVFRERILDAGGEVAAEARTTVVHWHSAERRPVEVTAELRRHLGA